MCITSVISGALVTVGVVLIGLGAGLGWGLFPAIVRDKISSQKALVEGTDTWDAWVEVPFAIRFEVYLFEVTNPAEVLTGVKPTLLERGPYVYDEWRKKDIIEISADGTEVTYSQVTTLLFNQELSGDLKESDTITVFNAALMGAVLTGDKADDLRVLGVINGAAPFVFPGVADPLFSTNTVKNVLFDGQLLTCAGASVLRPQWLAFCTGLKNAGPKNVRPEYGEDGEETGNFLYSYLYHKNGSTNGVFTINTGVEEVTRLGTVEKWGEDLASLSDTMTYWSGPECNRIKGTDGSILPPFFNSKSIIEAFGSDICRSLYTVYEKDIVYQEVNGLRFVVDDLQLGTVRDKPENYCYCADNSACPKRGTVDLSSCVGAPVVMSFPHFYQGPEEYLNLVEGLEPDKEKHQIYLDVEPNTGLPLSARRRVQMNMMLKKVRDISATGDAPSALMPMLWIDEGLDLGTANVDKVKEALGKLAALDGLRWGLIGVGIAVIVGGVALFCFC